MTSTEPPDPIGTHTAAELVDRMAELRLWAGQPSLRTLNRLAGTTTSPTGATTDALPTTTVSWVLNGKGLPRLPRMAFVEAFVTACLTASHREPEDIRRHVERWRTAWHAIAADEDTGPRPVEARHQLPMDIPEFTGRQLELDRLRTLTESIGSTPTPLVVTITGMAGVGKTRLAIRAAHLLAHDRFDEVQLWADLRGFHPEQPPATPLSMLENFLLLLGVLAHQLPAGLEARAALYRDRLNGRRVLIVLDDAASEDQIYPLLPGTPGCLVLITSRRGLTGLDGTHDFPLETFEPAESLLLLGRHAGAERVRAEPDAARRLTDLCGHLPLAVAVAGRYLRSHPALSLSDLADRLTGDRQRLADLSPHARSVQAVFDLSYRALPADHQRFLRLLATHPGQHFGAPSVAALASMPAPEAQAILDDLLDEHLLHLTADARYAMHDLVRDHLARHHDTGERRAALERLARHYLHRARHATLLVHPTEHRRVTAPSDPVPWQTPAEAVTWAETEYDNLFATVHRIAESPDPGPALATELVTALYRPLANRGHSTDRITLNEFAARVAHRTGDRRAEAQLLEDLGTLCSQVGRASEAVVHSHRALAIWTELGDRGGQRGCLTDLGNCCRQQGDHDKAIEYLQQALTISVESGDRLGEASVRNFLGLTYQGTAEFDEATRHLQRSATIYTELGNQLGVAIALANHGWALQRSGLPRTAVGYHRQSLEIFRELEDRYNEAEQHWGLGQAMHQLDHPTAARRHWHTAITMLHDIHVLDDQQTAELLAQEVPETPELIRLNT
ncbi:MAG: tetratricopeptide repeat protein [Labedaea sp.]